MKKAYPRTSLLAGDLVMTSDTGVVYLVTEVVTTVGPDREPHTLLLHPGTGQVFPYPYTSCHASMIFRDGKWFGSESSPVSPVTRNPVDNM